MKALKEKRINLRSLWRMGLVVLSVLALSFAACGDSGSGDNAGGGGVITNPPSTEVPTYLVVEQLPLQARSGPLFEGQVIQLAGIVAKIRNTDGQLVPVTDLSKLTITPSIYDYRVGTPPGQHEDYPEGFYPNGYELSYQADNGRIVRANVTIPGVLRILDLDIGGELVKKDYAIDEIIDFTGLQVYGVYSYNPADNRPFTRANDIPGTSELPPGWAEQANYDRALIPITHKNPDYRWAWVWNRSPGLGGFIDDSPGVLISIGSYGYILSRIRGEETPANLPLNATQEVLLRGKRERIRNLYQVTKLEWDPAPSYSNPIFYDDPRLIGRVSTPEEFNARMATWIEEAFSDARIKVSYGDPIVDEKTKTYTLSELQTMNIYYADTPNNYGWGGTWANLDIFPVNWGNPAYKIDLTRDTKLISGGTGPAGAYEAQNFDWLDRSRDDYDPAPDGASGGTIGFANGTVGWAQWAQYNEGRSRMRFQWRNYPLDTAVRIYNRPASMSVARVTGSGPVELTGGDYVYRIPQGMYDFLGKVKVTVSYVINGNTGIQPVSRDDVMADILAGKCRATVDYVMAFDTTPRSMPSLYSPGIWNFRDTTGDWLLAQEWMDFANRSSTSRTPLLDVVGTSLLTKANADRYAASLGSDNVRTARGRIEYWGWAGDFASARRVTNQDIAVAPIGYVFDPDPNDY